MTTYYASPIGRYDANPHHDDPTLRRPAVSVTPLTVPAASPWKSGWIVSGLAALLAAAALAVVGSLAINQFTTSEPTAAATSAPMPAVAPAPIMPAAVPAPTATPRVVVVTVPHAPIVTSSPVVTSPKPVEPPAPIPLPGTSSGGIGTCDLVACNPVPPTSGNIPSCGDFRACGPAQPVQPTRPRD